MPTTESNTTLEKTKAQLVKMLKENTGREMCDSGDYYGRMWQRNQEVDFDSTPNVVGEVSTRHPKDGPVTEVMFTVSVYHFLLAYLEVNDVAEEFNAIPVEDWEGELSWGLSLKGEAWLKARNAEVGKVYNTYNGESDLSQILQFRAVHIDGEEYVLLQIHGGCDARSGYTDAKLFHFASEDDKEGFEYQRYNVTVEITNSGVTEPFSVYGPGNEWVDVEGHGCSNDDLPLDENSKVEFYCDFGS